MLKEVKHFKHDNDTIVVTIEDSLTTDLRWKMSVNGKESEWNSNFKQILVHEGYFLHTDYFSGNFGVGEFHPVRFCPALKTLHVQPRTPELQEKKERIRRSSR